MSEAQNPIKDAGHTLPVGKNVPMAVLAYLGPLVAVSYLLAKGDPFVKFHIKQGLLLFVAELILMFGSSLFYMLVPFWMLWQIINFAILVLAIIGIMNAAQGNEKELPLVGPLGKHFPI